MSPRTQMSLFPFPYESHFPISLFVSFMVVKWLSLTHTLMHTGTSGKTRRYTFAPLTILSLRLSISDTLSSCFAVRRAPFPLIRMPHSPKASVVPLIDPPVGIGMVPLCLLSHFTFRGASWERCRVKISEFEVNCCTGFRIRNACEKAEHRENMACDSLSVPLCKLM